MDPSPRGRFLLEVDRRATDVTVARVRGDLDAHTAPAALGALADLVADGPASIVLDLADVEFVDSHGLRVLLDARAGAQRRGGELSLRNVSRPARRVLLLVTGGRELLEVAAPAGA